MEDDIGSCMTTHVILLPCMWKMITYWLLHLPIKNAGVYAQILGKMHKSIWQKLAQIHIKSIIWCKLQISKQLVGTKSRLGLNKTTTGRE
jgi:hypothetical protein